ncbi:hypothetical protein Q1695_007731 [Nippostrongylus brasiliensis]|nr:hypothetical protein Q1695_007731 [Nippostrongylus brasiliensis]
MASAGDGLMEGVEKAVWPYIVYFGIAYTSAPIYVAIIVGLLKNRKNQLGVSKHNSTFFRYTTANISYKVLYYTLSLRCFGVTLISFQRYVSICKWNSRLSERIAKVKPGHIALVHWTLSLVFVIPILTMRTIRFGCVCKELVAMDPHEFLISTINAEALVLVMFSLCVFFYSMALIYIYNSQKGWRKSRTEVRLCVPVAALILAFFLIFLYHLIQMISIIVTGLQLRPVRVLEPLFIGFLTFITPWSLLFFSAEVSGMFNLRIFRNINPVSSQSVA